MAIELTDEEWEAPLDDETEAQIDEALANARDFYDYEVAASARYVAEEDLLLLVLNLDAGFRSQSKTYKTSPMQTVRSLRR